MMRVAKPILAFVVFIGVSQAALADGNESFEHGRLRRVLMTHPAAPGHHEIYLEFGPEGRNIFIGPRNTFGDVPSRPAKEFTSSAAKAKLADPQMRPYDSTVAAYDVQSGVCTQKFICMPKYGTKMNRCHDADLAPDGKSLAMIPSGTESLRLVIFDVATAKRIYETTSRGHEGAAFVNGSQQVVTARGVSGLSGELLLHDLTSRTVVKRAEFQKKDVRYSFVCRSTPSGRSLAVGRSIWSLPDWKARFGPRSTGDFLLFAITPDGQQTVSGKLKQLVLWNGEEDSSLSVGDGYVKCAGVTHAGRHAAVGSQRSIFIVRLDSGEVLEEITVHYRDVCAVAFSPDGNSLASAAADGSTCIWDVADLIAE